MYFWMNWPLVVVLAVGVEVTEVVVVLEVVVVVVRDAKVDGEYFAGIQFISRMPTQSAPPPDGSGLLHSLRFVPPSQPVQADQDPAITANEISF